AQLLQDPVAGGMCTGVEIQDPASTMFDHEKAIQNVERQRRHGEEVQCVNHFTMILQESEPVLRLAVVTEAFHLAQVARHGGLRNLKAQLEQFAVNARRTPTRVVRLHAPDQVANLSADLRSARSTKPGSESPKQPD